MGNRLILLLLIITGALAYAVFEASRLDKKLSQASNSANTVTIRKIPESLVLADYKSGEAFDFNDYLNKDSKIFVHFWATWCGPCEVEFPELAEMINHFSGSDSTLFFLIAVNDDKKKIAKFLNKFSLKNKNVFLLVDDDDQYQRFGTYKMPESYLFAPSGDLIKRYEGQRPWTQEYLINDLK